MSGLVEFVAAHAGLLLFSLVSIGLVAYLLYAMLNPSRF